VSQVIRSPILMEIKVYQALRAFLAYLEKEVNNHISFICTALLLSIKLYLKGRDGFMGQKGNRGIDGLTGERGEKGEDGVNGLPGEPGAKGYLGLDGDPGIPGLPGSRGVPGRSGRRGITGDKVK